MRRSGLSASVAAGVTCLMLVSGVAAADHSCRRAPTPRVVVELSEPELVIHEVCGETCYRGKEKHSLFKKHYHKHRDRESRLILGTIMVPQTRLGCGGDRQGLALGLMQAVADMETQEAMRSFVRAAEDAETKATLGSMERAFKTMNQRLSAATPGGGQASIESQLQKLSTRLDEIETLLRKHDSYLQSEILKKEGK